MRLRFQCIEVFPRLAWCVRLIKSSEVVDVLHGPWVEVADDFFWEGAWAGDFLARRFETAQCVGSGGTIRGSRLLLASPNHTLERLFGLRRGRTLWLSNSLDCMLACAGDNVEPGALLYSVRLASIAHGLRSCARTLPTRNGNRVRLYYHCSLAVDSGLNVNEAPKPPVREFTGFEDYRAFLLDQVAAIHANAAHPSRRVTYRPMATISSGYDSPAAAVLARSVGCTEALTFAAARTDALDDAGDSGVAIAAKLGMQARVFGRLDYLRSTGCPEAEFLGWGAQESVWAPFLEARVLFTGFHGDKMWDRNCKEVGPYVVRGDPSGHNLGAFRLRVGWIHLPVPFLGCTSHSSIHRISTSPEMTPWSLGNDYDRPIPRRLVEEAGIAREAFGMRKRAAGVDLVSEGLRERMTTDAYEDYLRFYRRHWNGWMSLKRRLAQMLRDHYDRNYRYNKRIAALLKTRLGLHVDLPMLIPRDLRIGAFGDLDMLALLPQWSIDKLVARYPRDLWKELCRWP